MVSVDSFARYQREEAWTWEHMALTRARAIYGSPAACGAVEAIVARVLGGERAEHDIAGDAAAMRAEMAQHKPPQGPLDAKLLAGGLVDLEFAVHVAQLTRRIAFTPELGKAIDALIAAGVFAPALRPAYDLLGRLLVTVRLIAPDAQEPAAAVTRALIARAVMLPDWETVLATLATVRESVAASWQESIAWTPSRT